MGDKPGKESYGHWLLVCLAHQGSQNVDTHLWDILGRKMVSWSLSPWVVQTQPVRALGPGIRQ